MTRAPITSTAGAMREAHRHYRRMQSRHPDWSIGSSLRISWAKHRHDSRNTDRLMQEIAATIARHMAVAVVAVTLLAGATDARAQVPNRDGWSESNTTGGSWGQTRDGNSWRSQSDGYGGSTYSDTSGRSCWSQSNGYGGTFTSCN